MKISIHRPEQIGGQITRISTDKASIIIDLGHNLPNNKGEEDPIDNREAIEALTAGCDAILYTHYHGDHVGLCKHVPQSVPQYIDAVSKEVMLCKDWTLMRKNETYKQEYESVKRMKTYEADTPIPFGDIKVTPYFVSHSAGYAHMFLIEAEGKRILHTGDFRKHGLLSKGLFPTLRKYIKHVDVLITEGTMLSRKAEGVLTEHNLGMIAERCMKDYKYVFVQCSTTDLERLAVIGSATKSLNRPLVCDKYQDDVIKIFSRVEYKSKKVWDFGDVNTFSYPLLDKMRNDGFTMLIRPTQTKLLKLILKTLQGEKKQILFIYSMWDGYITQADTLNTSFVKLQEIFKNEDSLAPILNLHTSGHATTATLRKVCETLRPSTAIIPIHREKDSDFKVVGIGPDLQEKIVTNDCTLDGIDISFL